MIFTCNYILLLFAIMPSLAHSQEFERFIGSYDIVLPRGQQGVVEITRTNLGYAQLDIHLTAPLPNHPKYLPYPFSVEVPGTQIGRRWAGISRADGMVHFDDLMIGAVPGFRFTEATKNFLHAMMGQDRPHFYTATYTEVNLATFGHSNGKVTKVAAGAHGLYDVGAHVKTMPEDDMLRVSITNPASDCVPATEVQDRILAMKRPLRFSPKSFTGGVTGVDLWEGYLGKRADNNIVGARQDLEEYQEMMGYVTYPITKPWGIGRSAAYEIQKLGVPGMIIGGAIGGTMDGLSWGFGQGASLVSDLVKGSMTYSGLPGTEVDYDTPY